MEAQVDYDFFAVKNKDNGKDELCFSTSGLYDLVGCEFVFVCVEMSGERAVPSHLYEQMTAEIVSMLNRDRSILDLLKERADEARGAHSDDDFRTIPIDTESFSLDVGAFYIDEEPGFEWLNQLFARADKKIGHSNYPKIAVVSADYGIKASNIEKLQ